MNKLGYAVAAGCLLVGLSRFGHNPFLTNPQPKTAIAWMVAAVIVFVIALVLTPSPGSSNAEN